MNQVKNIFINYITQIPNNFLEKLKDILIYLFKIERQIDIFFFEITPLLFLINGSVVLVYHNVYIRSNKELLIPQQKPK